MFISDPTFFHPGSELSPSRIRIKEFKYFNPKKWFLNSGLFIPDPGSRIQGSKRHRIRDHDPQLCFDADLGFFIKLGWYGKILIRAGHVFHCLMSFFVADDERDPAADPDSESEEELDSDREDLEQPVLLRRPRFLRTPYRRVNSLKEAMKPENYHILPEITDPKLHST
jgi:hypothetical protein